MKPDRTEELSIRAHERQRILLALARAFLPDDQAEAYAKACRSVEKLPVLPVRYDLTLLDDE